MSSPYDFEKWSTLLNNEKKFIAGAKKAFQHYKNETEYQFQNFSLDAMLNDNFLDANQIVESSQFEKYVYRSIFTKLVLLIKAKLEKNEQENEVEFCFDGMYERGESYFKTCGDLNGQQKKLVIFPIMVPGHFTLLFIANLGQDKWQNYYVDTLQSAKSVPKKIEEIVRKSNINEKKIQTFFPSQKNKNYKIESQYKSNNCAFTVLDTILGLVNSVLVAKDRYFSETNITEAVQGALKREQAKKLSNQKNSMCHRNQWLSDLLFYKIPGEPGEEQSKKWFSGLSYIQEFSAFYLVHTDTYKQSFLAFNISKVKNVYRIRKWEDMGTFGTKYDFYKKLTEEGFPALDLLRNVKKARAYLGLSNEDTLDFWGKGEFSEKEEEEHEDRQKISEIEKEIDSNLGNSHLNFEYLKYRQIEKLVNHIFQDNIADMCKIKKFGSRAVGEATFRINVKKIKENSVFLDSSVIDLLQKVDLEINSGKQQAEETFLIALARTIVHNRTIQPEEKKSRYALYTNNFDLESSMKIVKDFFTHGSSFVTVLFINQNHFVAVKGKFTKEENKNNILCDFGVYDTLKKEAQIDQDTQKNLKIFEKVFQDYFENVFTFKTSSKTVPQQKDTKLCFILAYKIAAMLYSDDNIIKTSLISMIKKDETYRLETSQQVMKLSEGTDSTKLFKNASNFNNSMAISFKIGLNAIYSRFVNYLQPRTGFMSVMTKTGDIPVACSSLFMDLGLVKNLTDKRKVGQKRLQNFVERQHFHSAQYDRTVVAYNGETEKKKKKDLHWKCVVLEKKNSSSQNSSTAQYTMFHEFDKNSSQKLARFFMFFENEKLFHYKNFAEDIDSPLDFVAKCLEESTYFYNFSIVELSFRFSLTIPIKKKKKH